MAPPKKTAENRSAGGAAAAKAKPAADRKRKANGAATPAKSNGTKAKRPRKDTPVEEEEEPLEQEDASGAEEENGNTSSADAEETADDDDDTQQNSSAEEEQEMEEEVQEAAPPKKQTPKKKAPAKPKTKAVAKPKAKAPTKPKATAKAKAAGATTSAAAKKRKTQDDRARENAPLAAPFFRETGVDWACEVDLDELAELRAMWELPAACHVLWLLQTPLTLRVGATLLEYEAALLNPESSTLLEDVFTKLLLKKSERDCLAPGIGLKYEWWNKQLREYYMALYDRWYALLRKAGEKTPASFLLDSEEEEESGGDEEEEERDVELSDDEWLTLDILKSRLEGLGVECPLKHQSFSALSIVLRCKILLNLCEAVVDDPANTDYIRQMEEDDLRVESLGRDRVGNLFYYFPQFYNERRMYRLEVETNKWALWAKGDDAFTQMHAAMKAMRGRKARGEQELLDHLEVLVEQIGEEVVVREKELEKATKKAILEAIPRKRSMRIQVKQIEQLEKAKEEEETKRVLTLEEIAELKRAELLRKVEQEAEREQREKEREARRLAREEAEKEAALAEREQRRQRRLEKEKQEEEQAARAEEARKLQEEARKLRALQRKTVEDEQEDEDEEASHSRPEGEEETTANGVA